MDITITINCDNSAFDDPNCGSEVQRILSYVAVEAAVSGTLEGIRRDLDGRKLRDSDGNTVGIISVRPYVGMEVEA